ncbi:MAG: hypothetical protein FRX48_06512 [Lasallia pustulata]|uniref:Uncharacterized protein n=1 Tax=Lasallia pustulata TaxID=136370 RepID=A0A5M8PKB7_9LECA|nr:MAG: hypothetical protein FRX48_06512 [Lasallia pustulata]
MIEKAQKRHFREADTVAFDSQFSAAVAAQTSSSDAQRANRSNIIFPNERQCFVDVDSSPGGSERLKPGLHSVIDRRAAAAIVDPSLTSNGRNRTRLQRTPPSAGRIVFPWCANPPNASSASGTNASHITSEFTSSPNPTR